MSINRQSNDIFASTYQQFITNAQKLQGKEELSAQEELILKLYQGGDFSEEEFNFITHLNVDGGLSYTDLEKAFSLNNDSSDFTENEISFIKACSKNIELDGNQNNEDSKSTIFNRVLEAGKELFNSAKGFNENDPGLTFQDNISENLEKVSMSNGTRETVTFSFPDNVDVLIQQPTSAERNRIVNNEHAVKINGETVYTSNLELPEELNIGQASYQKISGDSYFALYESPDGQTAYRYRGDGTFSKLILNEEGEFSAEKLEIIENGYLKEQFDQRQYVYDSNESKMKPYNEYPTNNDGEITSSTLQRNKATQLQLANKTTEIAKEIINKIEDMDTTIFSSEHLKELGVPGLDAENFGSTFMEKYKEFMNDNFINEYNEDTHTTGATYKPTTSQGLYTQSIEGNSISLNPLLLNNEEYSQSVLAHESAHAFLHACREGDYGAQLQIFAENIHKRTETEEVFVHQFGMQFQLPEDGNPNSNNYADEVSGLLLANTGMYDNK